MDHEEKDLMVDVSILYYIEGKTQNEIAKALYLSRPKVSRLLKKARDMQIVDITINYESDTLKALERKIQHVFKVEQVTLTKTMSSKTDTLKEVGKAAAKVLMVEFKKDMTVGISWGKNIRTAVSYIKPYPIEGIRFVETFGAISYETDSGDVLSIGVSLSQKLNGKLYPLPSPIYIHDSSARESIENTPIVKNTLNMIENCDLIVTGIGSIESDSYQTLWDKYVKKDMKDRIIRAGGVGFICAHFFDSQGQFLDLDVNDDVIGIKTETVKKKRTIVIGAGIEKAKAIYGALNGGLISRLVTDEETILEVIRLMEARQKK